MFMELNGVVTQGDKEGVVRGACNEEKQFFQKVEHKSMYYIDSTSHLN